MRVFLVVPVWLALISCGGARSAPPAGPALPPSAALAIAHVTVVDVATGGEAADRTVLVDGDRIVAVVPAEAAASTRAGRTVDGKGKFLIPGLWDMHVHFADPSSARLFVANGVTGVRVMWGNPRFRPGMDRFHLDLRDSFDRKEAVGPRMVIASQILDGPRPIWPNSVAVATAAQGRKVVDEEKAHGADFIKVYSLLPREVFFAIAAESKKQGLPFAGHVPQSVSVAEASDAGQRSIEHLTGLLVACSARESELRAEQAAFLDRHGTPEEQRKLHRVQVAEAMATYDAAHARALFARLVANDTWQCPTFTVLHGAASLDDPSLARDSRMQYVAPFARRMWEGRIASRNLTAEDFGAFRLQLERQLALVGEMSRAGVPLLAGTDELNPYCFAGFSLHDELGWLVKAGLTPLEALRAATASPARFLGRQASMGAVAEGKVADLVLLDADPLADIGNTRKIAAVVSRGTLHDRAALDRMLEEAKNAAAHPRWSGGFDDHLGGLDDLSP
jgi:imidazolonepropionase-like amidohydrolase